MKHSGHTVGYMGSNTAVYNIYLFINIHTRWKVPKTKALTLTTRGKKQY